MAKVGNKDEWDTDTQRKPLDWYYVEDDDDDDDDDDFKALSSPTR
ncbi:hypothetical protein MY4824_001990 [Beauveria thailandica]